MPAIDSEEIRELGRLACQPSHLLARAVVALRQEVARLHDPWPDLMDEASCPSCGARLAGPHEGDPLVEPTPFLEDDDG